MKRYLRRLKKYLPLASAAGLNVLIFIAIRKMLNYIYLLSGEKIKLNIKVPLRIKGVTITLDPYEHMDEFSLYEIVYDARAGFLPSGAWVIIDVGANIGLSSIIYASHVAKYGGHVYAIEPNPEVLPKLYLNIYASRLNNVTIVPVAIGEHDGFGILYVPERYHIAASLDLTYVQRSSIPAVRTKSVRVLTLASLLEMLKISHVDLLSLDVEGVAHKVLKASENILRSGIIKRIKIDIGDCRDIGELKDLVSLLKNAGFRVVTLGSALYSYR